MDNVQVSLVSDKRSWREFIELPYDLYRADPYWVAPLRMAQRELFDPRRHPFHRHAEVQGFLARRGGRVIGRVAAIHDRNYNEFQGEAAGFFGFFESVDEPAVARALLEAAREWLQARGARVIRGPMNPSTNYECGLLVEGFDSSPYVMMPYNPPYYAVLLEGCGLKKARDLYAYYVHEDGFSSSKMERVARRAAAANHIQIRPVRMKRLEEDAALVWAIYNSAWSRNWGFAPLSREEFLFMMRDMKPVLVPDLALVGEVEGRAVGFVLSLPNVNQALKHAGGRLFPFGLAKILYHKRLIRSIRVLVLGVLEEYRTAGVAAGFYAELFRRGRRLGYQSCEMSWVLEDNVLMRRSIEALGGKPYKTYRIYEWN